MIQTATVPSFIKREVGDIVTRYDGPKRITSIIDRRPHPSGVRMGSSPADIITYTVEPVTE